MRPLRPDEAAPVGRYRPLAELGVGGMGRVVLAAGPDGRVAAVKQIHQDFAHEPGFRARFAHEVAVSRRVSGAYTAAVLDADPTAEIPWLASVFVAGPPLDSAIKAAGPLPADALRQLAIGLASALADIHRAGLIHRDLKPGNVLLAADGPRVIDFGIARAAEGSDLTGTGAVVGSPSFMSPEQADGAHLTPASDVFSLGVLLVLAATGRSPFTGETAPQTLYNIVHDEPDLSAVPPEIRALAEPCLAKDPARRPTPAQILDHLGSATPGFAWPFAVRQLIEQQESGVRTVLSWPAPLPPPAHPPPRRRAKVVAAAAAGVAALAAAAIVAVNLGSAEPGQAEPQAMRLPVEQALSTERLRGIDPCAVLADGFDGLGSLEPEDSLYLDRCDYRLPGGDSLDLHLGQALTAPGAQPGSTRIQGLPVLHNDLSGGCEVTVQLPDDPKLGITVEDRGEHDCDRAEAALSATVERLRTGAAVWDLPDTSAIPRDPCSFVDDSRAGELLGAVTGKELTGLRTCEWSSGALMRMSVEQWFPDAGPEEGFEPVELDGVTGYQRVVEGDTCALTWTHRGIDDERTELIRLFHTSAPDRPCERAQDFANAVISELPTP
ncbi:serine/threonine-protein kinase [Prauserella cavernicola]|uniref:Serine/threonine protein kinase n=1 Tax=Prauserella cavernicola TaxID=2800127 RepID=A0A934V597_9PSEU|nr:serine/threonine-protein kinase [Prauserella cavernicola]MBK1785514.1 serine/threonine protein kinase [Prauserella cavernicola]